MYHELRVYNEISRKHRPIFYYRTASGVEVDFIIETAIRRPASPPHLVAIEVKRAERWDRTWDKALRGLAENTGIQVDRLIGVYCGQRSYRFDQVEVWPYGDFVKALFAGEIF
jgi:predicted AAA+ superfamily ATPase